MSTQISNVSASTLLVRTGVAAFVLCAGTWASASELSAAQGGAARVVAAEPAPASKGDTGATEIVSEGTARVTRPADRLDMTFSVDVLAPTASEAQAQATARAEVVVKGLRALGLKGAQIRTGRVDLSPQFDPKAEANAPARIVGYRAVNTIEVRTDDVGAAARAIDAALKGGANRVDGVNFSLKEALEAREEAIRLATAAAKRKAAALSAALDLDIRGVVNATSDVSSGGWGGRMAQNVAVFAEQGGGGEDAFVPGQVDVSATVRVTFRAVAKP
jgi:uncharacterized protein YggE